jgi:hypothetical protein
LTRRFDIGPVVLALGALVLLVALFLDWFGNVSAWQAFEITDLLLALLALAGGGAAAGLLVPDAAYVERRFLPWIVGGAFVLVADQLLAPPVVLREFDLETGAWLALAATVLMIAGAVLSLAKVSFAVAFEGRDRRQRVSAVDHRPPATESHETVAPRPGEPVARSSESLLRRRREGAAGGEDDVAARSSESLLGREREPGEDDAVEPGDPLRRPRFESGEDDGGGR